MKGSLSSIEVPAGTGYVLCGGGRPAPRAGKGKVPGRGGLFRVLVNAGNGFVRQPSGVMVW